MSAMFSVFFKDIPSIIFEPLAVIGVLGLIIALIIYRKERSVFYWTVIFALIFMIAWRVAIQIVSSRYAEILIFPATAAAAFFIFKLESLRKIFPALPEKFVRFLPCLCIAVLTIVSIGKNLKYDRSTTVIDTANAVKTDMTSDSGVYVIHPDWRWKVEYYLGRKVDFVKSEPADSNSASCQQIIADALKKSYRTVYIFVPAGVREPEISAADAGVDPSAWSISAQSYFNAKKSKIMRVYKYSAAQ